MPLALLLFALSPVTSTADTFRYARVAVDETITGFWSFLTGIVLPGSNPLPGTCRARELRVNTSTNPALIYLCNATGTGWDVVGSGGVGTPGGANKEVQINATGAFGGATGLSYDTATKSLSGDGSVHAYDITGDGAADTVTVKISSLAQARAHASMYAPLPELYLEGGVVEALENDPSAHVDVDRSQMLKITAADPGGSLSQAPAIHCTRKSPLPLLPSGPGGVGGSTSRGTDA